MRRSFVAAGAPLVLVLGAAMSLAQLGAVGGLTAPEIRPTHFGSWVEVHGTDVAIVSILWSIVLVWCAHLAIALSVILVRSRQGHVVAHVRGVPRWLWRGATRVACPLAVASVSTSMAIPAPSASAGWIPYPSAHHAPGLPLFPAVSTEIGWHAATDDAVVMERLELEFAPLQLDDARDGDGDVWVVEPGDHLWSIAVDQVRAERRDASETAIGRYWHRLVVANADRLVVPGQPDLIYPGQRIRLPRVSSTGGRPGR